MIALGRTPLGMPWWFGLVKPHPPQPDSTPTQLSAAETAEREQAEEPH